jgi:hypothetical protein
MIGLITLLYWQALIMLFWDELTEAAQYVYSYITAYHYYGLHMLDDFVREYLV